MKIAGYISNNRIYGEKVILALFMIVLLLSLSRYAVNGEPRLITSDDTASESLELYDGIEIVQSVVVTEEMNWKDGHYALKFLTASPQCTGKVHIRMEQGTLVEEIDLAVSEIEEGIFCPLPLTMTLLESGQAFLIITTDHVRQGELILACGPDYYGFGETVVDQNRTDYTLAQEYYYHIVGLEYVFRRICYLAVAVGCIVLFFLACGKKGGVCEETRGKCFAVFGVLTVTFLAMYYIYDSYVIIEPTYAEAVTNFLKYAREESTVNNLLIPDAGYLPLLPRLITLCFVKILRISSDYALYAMQLSAGVGCCMIWSFFVLYPFRSLLRLPVRILFCMLMMTTCFYDETLFFTNFVYWGILLILLFMISDMEQWNITAYWGITFICVLICLSKGVYVIMLPLMTVYLLLFWREKGWRNKVYALCILCASLLQLLYSFGGNGDGARWVNSADDMKHPIYWLMLLCRVCVNVTGYFLAFLGSYIGKMNGLLPVLALFVCSMIFAGFILKILVPMLQRKTVQTKWKVLYVLILFQFMTDAFYRITVKGVPLEWKDIWRVTYGPPGDKYEIFSVLTAFLIWIILLSMVRNGVTMGVAFVTLLCICCCARLHLSGIGSAEISDSRTYEGDIGAGWQQARKLIYNSSFFVPVREDFWSYSKNAIVYQVGEEKYFEESAGVNLGDMEEGYRSSYTLSDDISAENVIEVWIYTPNRIALSPYKAILLDKQGNVLQEAVQFTSNRNFRTGFYFPKPVSGVKTIQFTDERGQDVYINNYICWVSAW